ncbi:MAG: hypothetical protein A3F46_04850 [Legionellales bacterium RIFCSPHIGHO2_12_FULL_42_9]|nr:MAG: hypothetical protein A3F46_04850 [Legionellales bacterium RIFCSPHIGHO2_12_FULL_42_9]
MFFKNEACNKTTEPVNFAHLVEMTQYFACDFRQNAAPQYIATYDITSCVVLIIKNMQENKQCAHFGMAHINLSNVYSMPQTLVNLRQFIDAFTAIGGNLATASIQMIGGLINDPNQVRGRIKLGFRELNNKLAIKEPKGYELNGGIEEGKKGNGEMLTVMCDQDGTYIRKMFFVDSTIKDIEFNGAKAKEFLTPENANKYLQADSKLHNRYKDKTQGFFTEINALRSLKLQAGSSEYETRLQDIIFKHGILEQSTYTPVNIKQDCLKIK